MADNEESMRSDDMEEYAQTGGFKDYDKKAVVTTGARVEVLASGQMGVVERMDKKLAYVQMEDGGETVPYEYDKLGVREHVLVVAEAQVRAVGEVWKEGRAHKIQFANGVATAHTRWEARLWAKAAREDFDSPAEARGEVAKLKGGHSK